jgi:hypothetical protein
MPDHQGYGEISITLGEIPIHLAIFFLIVRCTSIQENRMDVDIPGDPIEHQLLIFLTSQCGFIKSALLPLKNDSIVTCKSAYML